MNGSAECIHVHALHSLPPSLLLPPLCLSPSFAPSDEEIDVVTVPSSERTRLSRKRSHPISAPCSRQNSPHPPAKRRKYHTKRLQRLSSAGSSGDGIESDDEARRASHNVLERKRRNDLKSSFQVQRDPDNIDYFERNSVYRNITKIPTPFILLYIVGMDKSNPLLTKSFRPGPLRR